MENYLNGKHIIVGITGGIAAYKTATLVRLLIKAGAEVQVVMTPAAKQFITPVTMSALTGKPVVSEFFTANTGEWHSHVDLGLWADAMVIAPATASTIGKMANGIADNMLVTTYLSAKSQIFVAPAMDLDMMAHPSTTANIEKLKSYGNIIIEPASGELASHLIGKGRMEEPEKIAAVLNEYFADKEYGVNKDDESAGEKTGEFVGKKVLITAGPTREKIDPVRYISNYSTGKMAYALADELAGRGADVTVVSGPVTVAPQNPDVKVVNVESAREMLGKCEELFPDSDVSILCAAVADYTVAEPSPVKIKREGNEPPEIKLVKNPDIAATLGKEKRDDQVLVGFALETDHEESNAQGKMERKNLDMIVLNSLRDKGAGFATDTNKVTIFSRKEDEPLTYPLKSKREVASDIADYISRFFVSLVILLFVGITGSTTLSAQELNCQIEINTDQIQTTNKSVFETLKTSITEYMNENHFTNLQYSVNERIECRMFFTIKEYTDNKMTGDLQVQVSRPVYNTNYNTTLLNFKDNNIEFEYQEGEPLTFNLTTMESQLTAILNFYAYLFIALDCESFAPNGGEQMFDQLAQIVQMAQSSGETGWKAFEDKRNRSAILSAFTDPSTSGLRTLYYNYHRLGLDEMALSPDKGRSRITESLDVLTSVMNVDPMSVGLSIFRDAKLDELVNIYTKGSQTEREKVVGILTPIYPTEMKRINMIKAGTNKE